MTYQEFVNKYNGVGTDYDGVAGVQCVDLIKLYLNKVFGLNPGAWGNAYEYYANWTAYTTELQKNFNRIANTPDFIPIKGDIMVWNTNVGGGYGHVAICTGEGDTSYFYSYEQNSNGHNEPMMKIRHNYTNVYGVLRAKDQSKITGSGGGSGTTPLTMGTLWVDNDIYIFNQNLKIYSSTSMSTQVGTVNKGEQRKFVSFVIKNSNTFGKMQDGNYIIVSNGGNITVNAYGTVNCDVLNVRKSSSTSSAIVGTVSYGTKLLFTKENKDWAYAPSVGGWLYLGYIKGKNRKMTSKNRHKTLPTLMLIAVIIVIPLILISKCTTKNKTESDNVQANVTSTASALNSSESQTEIADDDQETYLFLVNDNTPFYAPDENEMVLFDYADGNIGGLYTGRYSKIYQGYIEIDYREDYVLVNEGYSCVIDCTNIIKLGVISQLNSMGVGYSACGVACVYMLANSKNIGSDEFFNYDKLLDYSEENGYGDQGTLLDTGGGMSAESIQKLAKNAYGIELSNAYDSDQKPSDIIKQLVDNGHQCIVLVKQQDGQIITQNGVSHFVLITGYI